MNRSRWMCTVQSYPTLSLVQECVPGHRHVVNSRTKGTNSVLMKLSSCQFISAFKITNMC